MSTRKAYKKICPFGFNTALSDSTGSEDAGFEPRTVATFALAIRRSNYSARSHPYLANNFQSFERLRTTGFRIRNFKMPKYLLFTTQK
jgi:hypothetical protein